MRDVRLRRLAELLAAADLRGRDREDDRFGASKLDAAGTLRINRRRISALSTRLAAIEQFTNHRGVVRDGFWNIDPIRLFVCTRPPSYFDVARVWLEDVEGPGFRPELFDELVGSGQCN